jgi:DNA-binding PadR family transcriptional regulator
MTKLDPVILGFLRLHPMTGYTLRRNIETSVGQFWTASFGGLYPALHRLVREGLIERVPESEAKIYDITEKGRVSLRRWLSAAAGSSTMKDGFLLRLFFASNEELTSLLPEMGRRLAENEDRKASLDGIASNALPMSRGQRFCLALGKRHLEIEQRLLLELQAEQLAAAGIHGSESGEGSAAAC